MKLLKGELDMDNQSVIGAWTQAIGAVLSAIHQTKQYADK